MAKPKSKKSKKGGGKKAGKTKKTPEDREASLAQAINNAKLWQLKVESLNKSREDYRNACKALAITNQDLTDELQGSERNSIDVLSFLKQEDLRKDATIAQLQTKLMDFDNMMKTEKSKITSEFEEKIRSLKHDSNFKDQEIALLQKELQKVKEFRHNKAVMQEEIESFKRRLHKTTLHHENAIANMERRFFDEKIKLEKEAGSRISELAERAHHEAVHQLDSTTKQVYQDNTKLTDALSKHIKESEILRKENTELKELTQQIKNDIETNDQTIKRKVMETRMLKDKRTELKDQVKELENKLETQLAITENQKIQAIEGVNISNQSLQQQVKSLSRALEIQSHDMRKLRRAASRVLKERSDVELFLISSLNQTRNQINASREEYLKACQHKYQEQMKLAYQGLAPYPKVTTFKKQLPKDKSTRSVYDGLVEAENANLDGDKPVDISDMTWEQRENILRLLFAQINSKKNATSSSATSRSKNSSRALSNSQSQIDGIRKLGGAPGKKIEPLPPLTPKSATSDQKGNGVRTFMTEIE